jgi:dienelactone hydrolase
MVTGFIDEMERLRADYVFMAFGGAKHSFTNPGAGDRGMEGLAYDAKADARSWRAMHDLFDEVFAR